MSLEDLTEATKDESLKLLMSILATTKNWPSPISEKLHPYNRCTAELSTYDEQILQKHRIVLPKRKVKQALKFTHETLQGVVCTKLPEKQVLLVKHEFECRE